MKVTTERALDRSYQLIKDGILDGKYLPGQNLREVAFAEELGVNRQTVKKAFFLLQADGLITIEPNKGAIVYSLSQDECFETLEVRALLEGYIARDAVENATEADVKTLYALLERVEEVAHDIPEFNKRQKEFHDYIRDLCKNTTAVALSRKLSLKLGRLFERAAMLPNENIASNIDHRNIADAFAKHDADLGQQYMNYHNQRLIVLIHKYFALLH